MRKFARHGQLTWSVTRLCLGELLEGRLSGRLWNPPHAIRFLMREPHQAISRLRSRLCAAPRRLPRLPESLAPQGSVSLQAKWQCSSDIFWIGKKKTTNVDSLHRGTSCCGAGRPSSIGELVRLYTVG